MGFPIVALFTRILDAVTAMGCGTIGAAGIRDGVAVSGPTVARFTGILNSVTAVGRCAIGAAGIGDGVAVCSAAVACFTTFDNTIPAIGKIASIRYTGGGQKTVGNNRLTSI